MAEPGDRAEQAAIWRRWRNLAESQELSPAQMPDALLVAAYAEGRLDEVAAEPVEAWLAAAPEALSDLAAARAAAPMAASEALIGRAAALIAAGEGNVVPLRVPTRRGGLRHVAGWGAIAASLLVTSLFGFAAGNDAYSSFTFAPADPAYHELLDPPATGLFTDFAEEPST